MFLQNKLNGTSFITTIGMRLEKWDTKSNKFKRLEIYTNILNKNDAKAEIKLRF